VAEVERRLHHTVAILTMPRSARGHGVSRGNGEEIAAAAPCSANAELYRRHHRNLQRAVSLAVNAPLELIEDACQDAWASLLRAKPDCTSIFGWLFDVAAREAYRLCEEERQCTHLDAAIPARSCEPAIADQCSSMDDIIEAREALVILAGLPDRQRDDLALVVAGYSYEEIAGMTGHRTLSTVRKHVAKAHARVRLARVDGTESARERRATESYPVRRRSP
jgi:DNA-directed RNA polymerase specialized sigma24 family protein